MTIQLDAAVRRLDALAREQGVAGPPIMNEDGAPSDQMLRMCDRYGWSLDWIFLGKETPPRDPKAPPQIDAGKAVETLKGMAESANLDVNRARHIACVIDDVLAEESMCQRDMDRLNQLTALVASLLLFTERAEKTLDDLHDLEARDFATPSTTPKTFTDRHGVTRDRAA